MSKIEPCPLLKKFYFVVIPGKALDIGCGQGDNSIFLARHNFEVEAIDINEKYISYLKTTSKRENLSLIPQKKDIRNFKFNKHYSLILAINCLQFMKESERDSIIRKAQTSLNIGGLFFVSVFTIKDDSYKKLSKINQPVEENTFYSRKERRYWNFFNLNELKNYFTKEFKILFYNERRIKDAHPLPHRHGIAEIVALKKNSPPSYTASSQST
jgi:2-polyprenyl-3-methyl-5-hydroxy-6-metoxy-1,4-benzoquinol methylase